MAHPPEKPDITPRQGSMASQARAWAIGLNFVYGVVGFALLGWALERWVWPKAAPWLLLGGLFLGLISSFYRFVREAMAINKKP
ncbi:MAG: hypothetical protein AMXMBFR58_15100 [Phycisphaerae bacterium]